MARKNKIEEVADTNAWMATFSDLLSLMLTFFVLLFSMKSMDAGKLDEALGYFRGGGVGPLELGRPQSTISPPKIFQDLAPVTRNLSPAELHELLKAKGMDQKVGVSQDERGMVLTISSTLLFDSAAADVRLEAESALGEVIELLRESSNAVVIEGHTDNVPIRSAQFPSNWELSLSRAVNVLKHFLENGNLDPKRFSVVGYADTRPVADKGSGNMRSQNRRVEVVLKNQAPSMSDEIPSF